MTHLLLASWLATQEWSWDRNVEPDISSYRICVGSTGMAWCTSECVTVPATNCDATSCWGDVPEPAWSPAFFIVTAIDSAGNESSTEHGVIGVCP